jgi:hypothetical protein
MELYCGLRAFGACLCVIVSNCKWHCTVQIKLVIAEHYNYTLWRVQMCGS